MKTVNGMRPIPEFVFRDRETTWIFVGVTYYRGIRVVLKDLKGR